MAEYTVYSTPVCAKCRRLKSWFDDEGIKYDEVDLFVDTEKADEFRAKNMLNLPIVERNGRFASGENAKPGNLVFESAA